jgi:shikimate kinase
MNLVLIGYRGTGKSVIGQRLGRLLKMPVVSLDQEIVRHAGQSIPDLVAAHGWPHFRDVEEEICRRLAEGDGQIIDCGGGVVERPGNAQVLRAHGRVFWLKAETATIVGRIGGDKNRPSLTGAKSFIDEVSEVLQRRTPLYQAVAHETVETDGKRLDDLAAWIAERWRGFSDVK